MTTTYRDRYNDPFRVEFITEPDEFGRTFGIQGPTASKLTAAVLAIHRDGRTAHVIDRSTGSLVLAWRNGKWTGRNGQEVTAVGSVRGPRLISDIIAGAQS